MLLSNNTNKVMDLLDMFDDLKDIDKVRLALHLLEYKDFNTSYDNDFITLLKEVLSKLDSNYGKVHVNFAKYKTLMFLSAKYMELSDIEQKNFIVEILFNIYNTDFNDDINTSINQRLEVFNYCYSLNIMDLQ